MNDLKLKQLNLQKIIFIKFYYYQMNKDKKFIYFIDYFKINNL